MYAIYMVTFTINIPQMLAYIPAPWIRHGFECETIPGEMNNLGNLPPSCNANEINLQLMALGILPNPVTQWIHLQCTAIKNIPGWWLNPTPLKNMSSSVGMIYYQHMEK